MKICVIGSSKRHDELCKYFDENNATFCIYKSYNEIPDRISAEYIVFPIPTVINGHINLCDAPSDLLPEQLMERTDPDVLAITCNYSLKGYRYCDIINRDDFAYLNAVPTAEGAIKVAIDSSDVSLTKQRVIILGFGRVGKILADKLRGLGCDITVAARSLKDRYYSRALGLKSIKFNDLGKFINDFDILFQTVPVQVLNDEILKSVKTDTTIIELSSGMRGTDLKAADENGVRVIDATRLPEKIAPVTAGRIWAETVLTVISEDVDGQGGDHNE